MNPTPDIDIGELRRLLDASPGEWTVWNPDASRGDDAVFHRGRTVCAPGGGGSLMAVAYCDYMTPEYAETHAALIAALRNAAPALLAAAEECERLHVQLAGCGVAAMGGTTEPAVAKRDDYGWSPSYQSVLDLRREYDALKSDLASMQEQVNESEKRAARAEAVVSAAKSLYGMKMMLEDASAKFGEIGNPYGAMVSLVRGDQELRSALATYEGKSET